MRRGSDRDELMRLGVLMAATLLTLVGAVCSKYDRSQPTPGGRSRPD